MTMKTAPLLLALSLYACADAPELGETVSALIGGTTPPIPPLTAGCPRWGCNENSPVMGPLGDFHELSFDGKPNSSEMRVIGYRFSTKGPLYRPYLDDGSRLVVESEKGEKLAGGDLAGGWLEIDSPHGVFRLVFDQVTPLASSPLTFWIGEKTPIETYVLSFIEPGGTEHIPLCNNPGGEGGENGQVWPNPFAAFFFAGDRYDAGLKLVTAIDDKSGFFNIACAGSALAKLHLNRHTTLGSPGPRGVTTKQGERQAMLKMFVSDVCGTGTAWTHKGTPLHWGNRTGWAKLSGDEYAHEALWNAKGALCLDTHRLGPLYQNPSDIYGECPDIPSCAGVKDDFYLTSAVPSKP